MKLDNAARQALRERYRSKALIEADRRGRSLKCGSPDGYYEGRKHAGDPDGCANDGSYCLCECHDSSA